MKQNLFNKLWLRVGMIVAIMTTALVETAKAADVTVTFNSSKDVGTGTAASGENSVVKDGITISCTSGGFAISGGAHYRLGSGSTTTISSTVGNIKQIVISGPSGTSSNSISKFGTNTGWTINSTAGTATWTGDATSVSIKANSGQVRPTSIAITYTPKAGSTYTVTLGDDNSSLTETAVGAGVTLPTRNPQGVFSFAGWCEDELTDETTTAPTIIPAGSYYPTGNITLYPVYSRTEGSAPTNASVSIADYASTNNWENETIYSTIQIDSEVSVTASTGTNTGKYYTNGNNWRIYSSEGATLTFNSTQELKTITLTYSQGGFSYGGNDLTSGTAINVSGTEVIINCTTKAFVTDIAVTYGSGTTTTYYTSNPVETVVADPVITLASEYTVSTTAEITCTTADATIQYSFDQTNWTTYTEPVAITTSTTIYAKATKNNLTPSNVVSASTTRKLTTPTFSPNGGSISNVQTITITSEDGATIYYTIDDTEPTTSSTQYTAPFALSTDCTIKAKAFKGEYESDVASATFAFVMVQDGFFDFESKALDYGSGVTTTSDGQTYITEDKTWTAGNVTLVSSGKYRWWNNDGTLRFYTNDPQSAMTISVPNGKLITSIGITGGTNFSADCGTYELGSWTGLSQSVTLTYAATSGSVNVKKVTVTYIDACKPTTITLNAQGYATFASTSPVDLDGTADCTAWAITAVSGTSITFTQVEGVVAAGTGLLLKGAAGAPITPEYSTSAGSPVTGNLLEAIVTPTDIVADQYYGLSGKTFVKVSAGTVPAGKALLPASALGSNVKAFTFVFEEDDATAIEMVNGQSSMVNGPIYNIAGQRISKMQKGINIVNGKKILK